MKNMDGNELLISQKYNLFNQTIRFSQIELKKKNSQLREMDVIFGFNVANSPNSIEKQRQLPKCIFL